MSSVLRDAQMESSQASANPQGHLGRSYDTDPESDASTPTEAWEKLNLLSLGRLVSTTLLEALLTSQLLDGGGIRGIWTLMTLERLMEYIGDEEERLEDPNADGHSTCSSFLPFDYLGNFSHIPPEEKQRSKRDSHGSCCRILQSRRYLPCHYFDFICGSSTGA